MNGVTSNAYNKTMDPKTHLSVALAVYNGDNLGPCLESIKSIAGEIVIVDGGSTDRQ